MFSVVLNTPAAIAGHDGDDHYGRNSLLISAISCESVPLCDSELIHCLAPLPRRSPPVGRDVLQRQP